MLMYITKRKVFSHTKFVSEKLLGIAGRLVRPLWSLSEILSKMDNVFTQGEDECSSVDYDDVATQWLSADFLDLRLRSSGYVL